MNYIYVWESLKVYCDRNELVDFTNIYGHNYSCHEAQEFYNRGDIHEFI